MRKIDAAIKMVEDEILYFSGSDSPGVGLTRVQALNKEYLIEAKFILRGLLEIRGPMCVSHDAKYPCGCSTCTPR